MQENQKYEVVIIGGSFAGLAAAMSLGRAVRRVCILDTGSPCNQQTPHSHNFLTHDGRPPLEILQQARQQVSKYDTLTFLQDRAIHASKDKENGLFQIRTQSGRTLIANKVILAAGLQDILPETAGARACWGISLIHCPYCHGYEYRKEATGIWANGDTAFDLGKMLLQWSKQVTIFTDGPSTLSEAQTALFQRHHVRIIEDHIAQVEHKNGFMQQVILTTGEKIPQKAMYIRPKNVQNAADVITALGVELNPQGYIQVDMVQRTNVTGVYACGDSAHPARAVANAVATGTFSGAVCNREMIEEEIL